MADTTHPAVRSGTWDLVVKANKARHGAAFVFSPPAVSFGVSPRATDWGSFFADQCDSFGVRDGGSSVDICCEAL